MNHKNVTPINTCNAFSPAEQRALHRALRNLSTTKYLTAATAYNGEITPLTFQVEEGRTYRYQAMVRAGAAETITINTPAVTFLVGQGNGQTTTDVFSPFNAADPAIILDAAGVAYFDFVFRPSASGQVMAQTSASETISAGSFAMLNEID